LSVFPRVRDRGVVLHFHLMATSAQAIHADLLAMPGSNALSYVTVTQYLSRAWFDIAKVPPNLHAILLRVDGSDRAPLATIREKLFSSVGELGRATHL
jgi:hypothetical protein